MDLIENDRWPYEVAALTKIYSGTLYGKYLGLSRPGHRATKRGGGHWGSLPSLLGDPIAILSIKDQGTLIEQSP